jgi:GxxExxY protein
VRYKGEVVGDYVADIIVEGRVLLELKAQEKLTPAHKAQVLNYLRATGIRVGLLVNFSYPKADIVRLVL